MCGISGIFYTRNRSEPQRGLLHAMNEALFHRGPDEGGLHIESGVGLGHRRLSIIDLEEGQQPLFNEDASVVVVFNGEIYNFAELRKQLIACGHRFKTHSDTEVIVHGWEEWGATCVEHMRGMFAIALWDRNRQQLFLARDRLGIKPLYYSLLANGELIFGSEIKALRAHPGFDSTLDPLAIEDYFGFGYVPEPRSIYRNTRKLEPGHRLVVSYPSKQLPQPEQYWDVSFAQKHALSDEQAVEEFSVRFTEAVDVRMVAEVPLGAFLSGGVDSSSVVATMAGLSEQPVRTCSIGFGVTEFDESEYADQVSERYGTAHVLEQVDPDDYSLLDQLAQLYDEPFADSSALPTYRVCELARQHVTVALSGDGGDEVIAGYKRYARHLDDMATKQRIPGLMRSGASAIGALFPDSDWLPKGLRKRQGLLSLGQDAVTSYFEINSLMKHDLRSKLLSSTFQKGLGGYSAQTVTSRHADRFDGDDGLSLVQYLDMKTYLPGDILTKVDRASMAHALEVRVPLLDHPLVEWSAGLPTELKLRKGEGKWLLKKAMEPHLSEDILYRRKRGFAVPLRQWFQGPLRDRVETALNSERLLDEGVFDRSRLSGLWQRHLSGQADYSPQIWSILMFESFLRQTG